jgi:DNA-binding HxlR family transcriptional regulator
MHRAGSCKGWPISWFFSNRIKVYKQLTMREITTVNNRGTCPLDFAFQRIGGKHRGKILWFLQEHQVLRYCELKRLLTGIADNKLTQTLKELERDGMVIRKTYPEVCRKVDYALTPSAMALSPLISKLREWAIVNM